MLNDLTQRAPLDRPHILASMAFWVSVPATIVIMVLLFSFLEWVAAGL